MKGTLFSADFVKDSSGNHRLLELNTDTAISNVAASQIDYSSFTDILNTESISEVVVIYKLFHENIVNGLENYINSNCPFITTFTKHLEEKDTIYPTTVVDSPTKFILRMAYDENAILDSEYCKNSTSILTLFADNNDLNSIPGFSYGDYDHLSREVNPSNVPDVVVKDATTTLHKVNSFYKIGKSSESIDDRFNELKTKETGKIITNFYNTGDTSSKSYRSLSIVYGGNLDVINLISYEVDAVFEKPTEPLPNDDTVISTEVDIKHYYEFSTNFIRVTKNHGMSGLLSEEEVKKSDGTYQTISDLVIGDALESYTVSGSPDSDVESVFLSWSYPGNSLPEGSSSTTATINSNNQFNLDYNMIVTLTTADDTIKMSPGTTVLVHQVSTNDIRYKFCYELDINDHKLVNVDGGLSDLTSVEFEILNETSTINSLDIEPSDVFFVKNVGGINFIVHNCFPEGTQINTPDGLVRIENLNVGDKVLSRSESGEIMTSSIGIINKSYKNEFINITLDNDITIEVTPKHPFLQSGVWTKAEDLVVGQTIVGVDGDVLIKSVTKTQKESTLVYNLLNVEPNNNYFVEGVLAHNKFVLTPASCFSAGTRITMSDHSEKFIEDVEVGDEVFGWDGEKLVPAKVLRLDNDHTVGSHATACKSLGDEPSLYTINETGVEFTPEHPFLTKEGWKSLVPDPNQEPYKTEQEPKVLKVGDHILRNGEWEEVTEIRVVRSNPEERVYNLVIDGVHSYVAEGIIVHNKL
jgi:hypothetical protein